MDEIFFLIEESPDGGYTAQGLGVSIYTQGDSLEEVKANLIDAVGCHFETASPKVLRLHIVRDEVLSYA